MNFINDRFSFDNLFRELLKKNFSYEEAKEYIENSYFLSALVFEERIENDFYKRISLDEESEDLIELKNRIFNECFLYKN